MLIKSIGKDGSAIPLSPEEALVPAISIGVSKNNDSEFVFWTEGKDLKKESFRSTISKDGYDAFAEGTMMIGKTRIVDDRFYVGTPHSFKIHYKYATDEIGAPHVQVVGFVATPIETNPANLVGEVDRTNVKLLQTGEITAMSAAVDETASEQQSQNNYGGKINSKKRF